MQIRLRTDSLERRIVNETSSLVTQIRQRIDLLELIILSETGSLMTPQFDNENWFTADTTIQ
jgi:hypothetical protein